MIFLVYYRKYQYIGWLSLWARRQPEFYDIIMLRGAVECPTLPPSSSAVRHPRKQLLIVHASHLTMDN